MLQSFLMFSLAKIRGKTETAKQFGVFDMLFEEGYDSMRMQRIFHPSSASSATSWSNIKKQR